MIREANKKDLDNLLELYLDLHEEKSRNLQKNCARYGT